MQLIASGQKTLQELLKVVPTKYHPLAAAVPLCSDLMSETEELEIAADQWDLTFLAKKVSLFLGLATLVVIRDPMFSGLVSEAEGYLKLFKEAAANSLSIFEDSFSIFTKFLQEHGSTYELCLQGDTEATLAALSGITDTLGEQIDLIATTKSNTGPYMQPLKALVQVEGEDPEWRALVKKARQLHDEARGPCGRVGKRA
jgi:hypothetical protein